MSDKNRDVGQSFKKLVDTVKVLRSDKGCPWDRKQKVKDVKNHILEEVYELCEAVDSKDSELIKEEIGDVTLLLVFFSALFLYLREVKGLKGFSKEKSYSEISKAFHEFQKQGSKDSIVKLIFHCGCFLSADNVNLEFILKEKVNREASSTLYESGESKKEE